MSGSQSRSMDRRQAMGALALPAVALALPRLQRGRAITQRGMVGGGVIQAEAGEARFSVFASRLTSEDGSEVVLGSVHWNDAGAGVAFRSTEIIQYEVLPSPAEGGELRRVTGIMKDAGAAEYPFALNLLDAGGPGAMRDSVALVVGDGALDASGTPAAGLGFTYAVAGAVLGDLQDIAFVIDGENVSMENATPTP